MMINQEEVCMWFKDLEGHSRIELMCTLLDSCLPLELRFLGTHLEYAAGKHYTHLQKWERDANNDNSINSSTNLSDTKIRRRLCIFLALLHSHNRSVALKLFDILNLYENFGNDLENAELTQQSDWSEKTSRNEMKLLLTMASLHPAFDFSQREILRNKLDTFVSTCVSQETEDVTVDTNEVDSTLPVVCSNSVKSSVDVSADEKEASTSQALLPSPQICYPLIKSYQYTIPIASNFPMQPAHQILIPRQPYMNPHKSNYTPQQRSPLLGNLPAQYPYVHNMHNMMTTSIPRPTPSPTEVTKLIPDVYNLPTVNSSSDLISLHTQAVSENENNNLWNRVQNPDIIHPLKNEKKPFVNENLIPNVNMKSPDVKCDILVNLYTENSLATHNASPVTKMSNSLYKGELRTMPSDRTVPPTIKEGPRRCFSESDANETTNMNNENIPFSKISTIFRTYNEFQVNHGPGSPVPVYFPYSKHNVFNESSNSLKLHNNMVPNCENGDDNRTYVTTTTSLLGTPYSSAYSKPSFGTKQNPANVYYASGKDIIPTGLNGGFITRPLPIPDTLNLSKTQTQLSDVKKPQQQQQRNLEAYHNPHNHLNENAFFPVQARENISSHSFVQTRCENIQSPHSLSATTRNHMITSNEALESRSISPLSSLSPRLSPFQSPGHSPMTQRKGAYSNVKENSIEALESAAFWLRSLRLHKYSHKFEGYTFQKMRDLDEDDLERLGLTVGARKKFKQAVDNLITQGFKEFGIIDKHFIDSLTPLLLSPSQENTSSSKVPQSVHNHDVDNTVAPKINSVLDSSHIHQVQNSKDGARVACEKPIVNDASHNTIKHGQVDSSLMHDKQTTEEVIKTRKKSHNATCYNCGLVGHYGDECTEQTMEAQTYSRYAFHLDFSNNGETSEGSMPSR